MEREEGDSHIVALRRSVLRPQGEFSLLFEPLPSFRRAACGFPRIQLFFQLARQLHLTGFLILCPTPPMGGVPPPSPH